MAFSGLPTHRAEFELGPALEQADEPRRTLNFHK